MTTLREVKAVHAARDPQAPSCRTCDLRIPDSDLSYKWDHCSHPEFSKFEWDILNGQVVRDECHVAIKKCKLNGWEAKPVPPSLGQRLTSWIMEKIS